MKIDRGITPGAVVGLINMNTWGMRPDACVMAWQSMAPSAKSWSILTFLNYFQYPVVKEAHLKYAIALQI